MKKILMILYEFYPYGSAITNCLNPIIKRLKEENINITVITRRSNKNLKKHEFYDDIEIFRVNDYFNIYNNQISVSKTTQKLFYKILLKITWLYRTKIKKDNQSFLNEKKAINLAKKILKNKYDIIFSASYPFSTHKIAYKLKRKYNIKWIAYQFDPHTFNTTLNPNLLNKRLEEEIKVLSLADRIFLPKENYNENIKTKLSVLKDKYYPIDFALIQEKNYKKDLKRLKTNKIIFVYTGTFYEKIRIPDYMLDFFKKVDLDYELHLYYMAEKLVEDKLLEYKSFFKDKLILHKNESKDICDEALINANILINVGNEIANQTPSKVFEYISLGKPIVNFYSIENDTSRSVLEKYPLILNINKNFAKDDVTKFKLFCKKNRDTQLSFEVATKNYKNANQIAKEFVEEVKKCYENK